MSTLDSPHSLVWVSEHSQERARRRAGVPADDAEIRALWWEAHPVDAPHVRGWSYARYHEGEDVLLIARFGALKTVVELSDRPEWEQRVVREQLENRS